MGSSKGTHVLGTDPSHPMGGAPTKLSDETPMDIKGVTAFQCGTSTFVVLVPNARKIGLVCMKNDEASATNIKVGDFVPFTSVLSIGREPDQSGRKCLRFPGVSNVSGAHCCIEVRTA